jgi:DNA-binding GntR family transcriptional regulator
VKLTHKQRAYRYIRQRLLCGSLSAGDRLSPEALSHEIGTSHIPVREAIGQLESEGLVTYIPHRGAFVRQPDRKEVEDLFELRSVFECHAVAQAARRIDSASLKELRGLVKSMREVVAGMRSTPPDKERSQLDQWAAIDMAFHDVLLRVAGNRQAESVVSDLVIRLSGYGYGAYQPVEWAKLVDSFAGNYRVHRDIYLAIRGKDPAGARRAMIAHMRRAHKNLLMRFEWISGTAPNEGAGNGQASKARRNGKGGATARA